MVRSERERRNDLMMKMKEVCAETELSERAVRLYVKEQLIKPTIVIEKNNWLHFLTAL